MSSPVEEIIKAINGLDSGSVNLMEVCGTHTMAIARSGIKSLLAENIRLISGPGCPVCVTSAEAVDAALDLARNKDIIIATYGDMIKVPGSKRGSSLAGLSGQGSDIRMVYSPIDALSIAKENPEKQTVFLGVGFETTAPGTAVAIKTAAEENIDNFTVFSMLKTCEPALRHLAADPDFNIQGLLCPGHVASIIGMKGFSFLPDELHLPSVISGFEAEDILLSIYMLLRQIKDGRPALENEYKRAVSEEGNTIALSVMDEVLEARDDLWRGMGIIKSGGLGIRKKYEKYDAEKRFGTDTSPRDIKTPCRCGEVIQGKISPRQCPMFARTCDPENPSGPCMVSGEGACAAEYKYNL